MTSAADTVQSTELWRVTRRPCHPRSDASGAERLLSMSSFSGALPGDVLVSRTDGGRAALRGLVEEIAHGDEMQRRSEVVQDVFRSTFADRLLEEAGTRPAQHLQFRTYRLLDVEVMQLAAYPTPLLADDTRLWCDAAIVWIFVPTGAAGDRVVEALDVARPLWERLRAHHGSPLDRAEAAEVVQCYPVPHEHVEPLTGERVARLTAAVHLLTRWAPEGDTARRSNGPRHLVEEVLRARSILLRHVERLSLVLDHSHGRASTKLAMLEEAAAELLPDDAVGVGHLLAPHSHLISGLEETRRNLERVVADASVTASLITSAAVSQLLDRSTANRVSGGAVAAAAFLAVVLSSFTALAAIPPGSGRAINDLGRLAGWVGVAGVGIALIAIVVATVAAYPAERLPTWLRSAAYPLVGVLVLLALAAFVATALGGPVGWAVAGGGVLLTALVVGALTNDF